VEAARLGSGRCVRLQKLARPWLRALAGGFNSGNKLLAAHAALADESGFRAWGSKVAGDDLTIGKLQQRLAGLRARAWASCTCGRVERARASGASGRSAHAAKKVSHGVSAHRAWPAGDICEAVRPRLRRCPWCAADSNMLINQMIVSDMVESDTKQYEARFCGLGMRWSRPGAERLISVRSGILRNRFDQRWKQIRICPKLKCTRGRKSI